MADYEVQFPRLDSTVSPPVKLLEAAGVRYCVVGDLVIMALGGPLVLSDIYLAVADDELELARYWATSTIIIPATFWHLDLSPESWTTTTFLVPDTAYRFPSKLVYLRAIIDAVAGRHGDEGLNGQITSYFKIQYSYLLSVLLDDVLACLPVEDRFFIDLFDKVILYSARKKVCYFRQQIRAGLATPETAKTLVPRKDLEIAALKAKHREPGQDANGGKPAVKFSLDSSNIPQRQAANE